MFWRTQDVTLRIATTTLSASRFQFLSWTAFQETTAWILESVLSTRTSASVPTVTKSASSSQSDAHCLDLKKDQIMNDQPSMTKRSFSQSVARELPTELGEQLSAALFGERFLASCEIVPKIGPLRVLQLRTPTPQTETRVRSQLQRNSDRYRKLLGQVSAGRPDVPNYGSDLGQHRYPEDIGSTIETHANLLDALAKRNVNVLRRSSARTPRSLRTSDVALRDHAQAERLGESSGRLEQLRKAPSPVVAG